MVLVLCYISTFRFLILIVFHIYLFLVFMSYTWEASEISNEFIYVSFFFNYDYIWSIFLLAFFLKIFYYFQIYLQTAFPINFSSLGVWQLIYYLSLCKLSVLLCFRVNDELWCALSFNPIFYELYISFNFQFLYIWLEETLNVSTAHMAFLCPVVFNPWVRKYVWSVSPSRPSSQHNPSLPYLYYWCLYIIICKVITKQLAVVSENYVTDICLSLLSALVFFYLLFKIGICQCLAKSLCKMCWAACETYLFALEDITCFLWHKLKNTKRVNRRRRRPLRDIEVGFSSSDESESLDNYRRLNISRKRKSVRDDRRMHRLQSSLYPLRRRPKYGSHGHHVRLKTREVSVQVKGGSSGARYSRQLQRKKAYNMQRAMFKKRRLRWWSYNKY